jgi:large subunit ribosomal protein L1
MVFGRQFMTSQILLARHKKQVKVRTPSKKALAAKAKRKAALKSRKDVFEKEKMTLADAIRVLRVSFSRLSQSRLLIV